MKPRGSADIRGQTGGMYRLALLVILIFMLPMIGCSQREGRRHPDDVHVQIRVERTDLRTWAKPDQLDMTITKGLFNGDSGGDFYGDPRSLVAVLAFVIICATVEVTIEKSVSSMRGTTMSLSVPGHPRYNQKLYWGDNRIYLPAACAGTSVDVVIRAKGAWRGRHTVQLDLAP